MGTPRAPTCRRSCPQGRAPGQSSAPTATAGGRGWARHSPFQLGTRAPVLVAPSPTLVSLCPSVPSHPWCGLFLPPALGFFLRKRGRRRPDPDVRGVVGRGSRECCCPGYFWPWLPPCLRKGHPGAQQSHTGAGTRLNISPVSPHSPSIAPQTALAKVPPIQKRLPVPPPASTTMSHPMAGAQRRGPHVPHGNTA